MQTYQSIHRWILGEILGSHGNKYEDGCYSVMLRCVAW